MATRIGARRARYPAKARPAKPRPIITQVEGSGTEVVIWAISNELDETDMFSETVRPVMSAKLSTKVKRPFDVEPVIVGVPSPGRLAPGTLPSWAPVYVISPEVVWMTSEFS